MIEIIGVGEESVEERAAAVFRDNLLAEWPAMATEPHHDVWIIPSAKCYGMKTKDVDLLVLGRFGQPLRVQLEDNDQPAVGLRSFCLAIEVKPQEPDKVTFEGNKVFVEHKGKRHDATEQNHKQKYAVLNYIKKHGLPGPFVEGLIWLTSVPTAALPKSTHNILGSDATWGDIAARLVQLGADRVDVDVAPPELRAYRTRRPEPFEGVAKLFTQKLEATRLDRRRIERICRRATSGAAYWSQLGKQLLVFRGRGGAGKTVNLLRVANHLYETEGARVLVLTYNKALVADIKRLLALMGIRDGIASRRIEIQTVHSYVNEVLRAFKLISPEESDFYAEYDRYLELATEKAASQRHTLAHDKSGTFGWDYLLVDEAQDWPPGERDLLYQMYERGRFVLADGIDQLVRSTGRVDWLLGCATDEYQIVPLKRLLRLKHGLYRFVTSFASHLGITDWEVEPHKEAYGGRVVILEEKYSDDWALHDELMRANEEDKNRPVDMLFCVPPSLVEHSGAQPGRSRVALELEKRGQPTWDGVCEDVRESYPTKLDQLRIVQYDSCRGLEGWIVVCLGLDEFYDYKLQSLEPTAAEEGELFFERATWAEDAAARWLMIPCTRAIDTLVLQIDSRETPLGQILSRVEHDCPDVVVWQN